ncbi:protein GrpE [Clostridium sp. CAG:533]|nr:protein GrpE [Clostridium sp. CAG:533]
MEKEEKKNKKEVKENKELKHLEEENHKLKNDLKESSEKVLRLAAEMQNYKKRNETEKSNMLKYANEDLAKSLLPILDNFERAIRLDDNDLSDEVSKFLSGFKMIYGSFVNVLNNIEVKEIECDGLEFDPVYHQAVLTEKDETKPSGVILEVLQKGYMYKDKVIRPAMVKVNE